jgi:hypothetical protein
VWTGAAENKLPANASIKPVQVSIEGLARYAVSLHTQQAGSVSFVLTTCRSDFAVMPVIKNNQQNLGVTPLRWNHLTP